MEPGISFLRRVGSSLISGEEESHSGGDTTSPATRQTKQPVEQTNGEE